MADNLQSTYNYLVPSTGTTRAYGVSEVLSATVKFVDFRAIELYGKPFVPSGVFIDNSQGTGPITIVINEMAFRIICNAGESRAVQYPAPAQQSVNITGLGQASVIFVDFPVIPYNYGP